MRVRRQPVRPLGACAWGGLRRYTFFMPKWVKVVLIVVIVGFVLVVAGVVVAARWIKRQGTVLKQQGEAVIAEARTFGEGKDGEACIAESLNRLKTSSGFIEEAKVKVFLQHCLGAATVDPKLCEGVPKPTEIMATAQWTLDECTRRGWANNQRCARVIGALQMHCHMPR